MKPASFADNTQDSKYKWNGNPKLNMNRNQWSLISDLFHFRSSRQVFECENPSSQLLNAPYISPLWLNLLTKYIFPLHTRYSFLLHFLLYRIMQLYCYRCQREHLLKVLELISVLPTVTADRLAEPFLCPVLRNLKIQARRRVNAMHYLHVHLRRLEFVAWLRHSGKGSQPTVD